MKTIAIMNHLGVLFKEAPVNELQQLLEAVNFRVVFPQSAPDLLALIENNAKICGVIFDWETWHVSLPDEIVKLNEQLPLYAFASQQSIPDIGTHDLSLNVTFFEYELGAAREIADRIQRGTEAYFDAILPPFTKALFRYVDEGKYTFCTPGHMGELPSRRVRWGVCSTTSLAPTP